jgi:hypothetical protein
VERSNSHPHFHLLWVLLFSIFYCEGFGNQILKFKESIICGYEKACPIRAGFSLLGDH